MCRTCGNQRREERRGEERRGEEWSGVEWSGVEWSGVEWSGVEWSGVEWSGVDWSGEWSGVESGVEWRGEERRGEKILIVKPDSKTGIKEKILLNLILKKERTRELSGLVWLGIGRSGFLLWEK
jgi:hypothetical protein